MNQTISPLALIVVFMGAFVSSGCMEAALMEAFPLQDYYAVYEDKYDEIDYSNMNLNTKKVDVDVSFEFTRGSNHPMYTMTFVDSFKNNIVESHLFNEISFVDECSGYNEFCIIFILDKKYYTLLKDMTYGLFVASLTLNNYDYWQQNKVSVQAKIYRNKNEIKEYRYEKSFFGSYYWFRRPSPKFEKSSEIDFVLDKRRTIYKSGMEPFFDEIAFDIIKDLAAEECFANPSLLTNKKQQTH